MALQVSPRRRFLSVALAAVAVVALLPAARVDASLSQESLKRFLRQVGAKVESTNGNLVVASTGTGRDRIEIRLVNDATKQWLRLYAFDFGNVGDANSPAEVYEYLLLANSELGIGGFFVDKDKDIGYKFFVDTRDPLSFEAFAVIYNAIVNVVKERGPKIRAMMKADTAAPKTDAPTPEELPAETMEPPPATPPVIRLR